MIVYQCPECHVLTVTRAVSARCPLCGGRMQTGPVREGTYSPLTDEERRDRFERMMRDARDVRG